MKKNQKNFEAYTKKREEARGHSQSSMTELKEDSILALQEQIAKQRVVERKEIRDKMDAAKTHGHSKSKIEFS